MAAAGSASQLTATVWPEEGLTRVPYRLFQDPQVYAAEQRALFQGPLWIFLCLAVEVANPGDFCTTAVGDTPVIVTRDADGDIYAFENRCAHRGALIALEQRGNAKDFSCVYHAWTYDRQGNLIGVAFKDGIKGKGGMPPSFCMQDHGPRKLRVAELHGLVFGSFSETVPPLEEYLGEAILPRIERVLAGRKPVVLGRYTQALPNNWKLYMENVKDCYHASILHLFFTTFELNRLSQRGGIIVDPSGGHHVSFSAIDRQAEKDAEYAKQNIRSDSELQARRPLPAAGIRGVRRRHHAADPLGVPDLRAAADPEHHRRAPDRAARHRAHRSQLDADRLRGRHARAAPDAAEAGQPGGARRLRIDGGRLRGRLRAARHRRRRR